MEGIPRLARICWSRPTRDPSLHPHNIVTGKRYVYAKGHHLKEFNGLVDVESKMIKEHIERLVTENQHLQVHSASVKSCRSLTELSLDLQLRYKWHPDDLVVWDNRATYHVGLPLLTKKAEKLSGVFL